MTSHDPFGPASSGLHDDDLGDIERPVYDDDDQDSLKSITSVSRQVYSNSKKSVKRGARGGARSKRSNEQIYESRPGSNGTVADSATAVRRKAGRTKAHDPIIVSVSPQLNDDEPEPGMDTPDTPSIMDGIDDVAKFHNLSGSDFKKVPWEIYDEFDDKMTNFFLCLDKTRRWSISREQTEKCKNLNNIGHCAIILNYSRRKEAGSTEMDNCPLIFGIKQEKLIKSSNDTLKIYEFHNTLSTADNSDVRMYIITTKKKYAVIMFEKVLLCPNLTYVSLKTPRMWIQTIHPAKI